MLVRVLFAAAAGTQVHGSNIYIFFLNFCFSSLLRITRVADALKYQLDGITSSLPKKEMNFRLD